MRCCRSRTPADLTSPDVRGGGGGGGVGGSRGDRLDLDPLGDEAGELGPSPELPLEPLAEDVRVLRGHQVERDASGPQLLPVVVAGVRAVGRGLEPLREGGEVVRHLLGGNAADREVVDVGRHR